MHLLELQEEIKALIKKHEIKVARTKFKSSAGRAIIEQRTIKIPRITDLYTAAVVIHEISHIILSHADSVTEYVCEYETEKLTIKFLRQFNIHKDYKAEFEKYVIDAKRNVKICIDRYIRHYEKWEIKPKIRKKISKWANS
jgi:hypothetical protein